MKTTALVLFLAATPDPIEVKTLSLDDGFVDAHPCAVEAPKVEQARVVQFCSPRARVVFTMRSMALTGQLEVFDGQSGKKLHTLRTFAGIAADAERVYFNDTQSLRSIALADPAAAPQQLGKQDCGGPAAPSVFAIWNSRPLCLTGPEQDETGKQQLVLEGGGVCRVPPTAWKAKGAGYTLTTELLSKDCRKMFTSARGTARP